MGPLKTEHCTLFSPEDETLPVEVFVKILESSTFSELSTDRDKVLQAKQCLDSNAISQEIMTEVEKQETWRGLKDFLISTFSKGNSLQTKVNMLAGLAKSPEENCHHYIARVSYLADLLTEADLELVLFLTGLRDAERQLCLRNGPDPPTTLEDFATLLNVPKMCTWDAADPIDIDDKQGLFLSNVFAQLGKILATLIGRFECYQLNLLTKKCL